jgi:hypothetical protein
MRVDLPTTELAKMAVLPVSTDEAENLLYYIILDHNIDAFILLIAVVDWPN